MTALELKRCFVVVQLKIFLANDTSVDIACFLCWAAACIFPLVNFFTAMSRPLANNLSSPSNFQYSYKAGQKSPTLLQPEMEPTMANDSSANSLADPILLETIDKLFQHNIGEYVSLPQVGP